MVLNGRDAGKLQRAAAGLQAEGIKTETAAFDVTDQAAVLNGVARIERDAGPIDILVNNAGIQRRAPLEEFAAETWHEVMRSNLDSVFYVGQAVARAMIPRGRGKIINVCSVQSELGRPSIAPYAASKGAVKMLNQRDVRRLGPAWIADQRSGTRLLRHRTHQDAGGQRRILRLAVQADPRRALGPASRNWAAPSCSSAPPRPTSSTARSSTSTAA